MSIMVIRATLGKKGKLEISSPEVSTTVIPRERDYASFSPTYKTCIFVYDNEKISGYEAEAKLLDSWEQNLSGHIEDAVRMLSALESVRARVLPARIKAEHIARINAIEIEESKSYVD